MEINILIIGLIIFLSVLIIATFKAFKRLFSESEKLDLDKKVTVRCPKCGETYNILESELAGEDGLTPVKCYKCGYEYKQKLAIVGEE